MFEWSESTLNYLETYKATVIKSRSNYVLPILFVVILILVPSLI